MGVQPAKCNYKLKKESCTFSTAVVGNRVKMLLHSVSNTNVYQNTFDFVNTDTPFRKKADVCEKIFTKTVT